MKRLLSVNQWSWKMKLAVVCSALWLLYWIITGLRENALFWGLLFGAFPLFVVWGAWTIAVGPRKSKETAAAENIVARQQAVIKERRAYERLVYPSGRRPSLKFESYMLEILNIAERGLKLSNPEKLSFDHITDGEAVLLSGKRITVTGKVAWSLNMEVGLVLDPIPKAIIDEEKRLFDAEAANES